MNEDTPLLTSDARGGLPHWQQKKLTQYIEEHLADEVSLLSLAQLAQLSPYHFSRAFKQSFGMPPHQYLTSRRIERAKTLLAERKLSVTEIGFDVGSSETSSFTAAFRKYSMIAPLFDATNPYAAIHQLLEADIVYVRDFTRPNAMSNEQLGQLVMIAHHCYRSHDLVLNCIHHLESRRAIASGASTFMRAPYIRRRSRAYSAGRKRRFGFSED